MKLIIDIPEEIYKASQIIDVKHEDVVQIPLEVIANGIPLNKIRAEIEAIDVTMGIKDYPFIPKVNVLNVIDKYREEQTDAT
jgi:hypothetical protein